LEIRPPVPGARCTVSPCQSGDPGDRAAAPAPLVRHLPEDERPAVTREAVAAADEADEHALACNAVLAELPEPRPGQLAAEAPAAAAEIGPENDKADILAWLINYLPGSLVPEAASISIALQDEALRAETLRAAMGIVARRA